ncbi:transcriptional regulator, Crp/Fnr family [Desulfacinum hydrothermale DSM 13146]|uniref:Transcriptional regulator, Crp/Fnr family n=1 Tax=Desulfacinum hydrothermale DSM 13146 TaxID=1121390 RepID=A0A1W1X8S2_9BACT|nr:Crp/Fnr family transcriptional regulator [Desulfacinum hydrothermale]SMC20319.1 transcriptional regulator, Crp/Fnr family [Desulfacinum hydrothermale DSM 13146]
MAGTGVEKRLDWLRQIPLFQGLAQERLLGLAQISTERVFSKGETVFSQGRKAKGFFVLVDGRIKVFKVSLDGREQILHLFEGGEIIGEVPVFAGGSYPAHAEAISRSTLIYVPRDGFVRLIREDADLAMELLAVLSRRLRRFTALVEDLSLKEVPGRLAAYLIYLAERNGGDRIQLDMTKAQLAALLGTIPETLSRIFSKLSGAGLLAVDGRTLTLLDREGLQALAQGEKVF